jgi:hypothetical protein
MNTTAWRSDSSRTYSNGKVFVSPHRAFTRPRLRSIKGRSTWSS